MLIQDIERRTGLDRATIRFYEKEGMIIPGRSENGYRSYSDADVELLLKVKLLRQLGVSLSKIKNLQQGSSDFSSVLQEQIEILDQKIQDNTCAKIICKQMQSDSVQFATLDSLRYLNMLTSPATTVSNAFNEKVQREAHPWRRYIARYLDYRIIHTALLVLLVMILRIRPLSSNVITLISYFSFYLAIPILAVYLHYLGTTPGKWLMGIRIENINGGKLSGGEALIREGSIVWHGMGLFIPILEVWRNYRGYKDEVNGTPNYWNEDSEIIYSDLSTLKKVISVATFIICILLSLAAGYDAVKPAYRGESLTMHEFVENYHDYEQLFEVDNTMILNEDGKWEERTNTNEVIIQIGNPSHQRKDFEYQLEEDGSIKAISFSDTWDNVSFLSILPDYCSTAIYTVTASRPRVDTKELIYLEEELITQIGTKLGSGGKQEGRLEIADVVINWKAELPEGKYLYNSNGMIFSLKNASDGTINADDEKVPYSLEFTIEII